MKKIITPIFVLIFTFVAFAQSASSDEAKTLFEKGEYLKGISILTKALNEPDPVLRAKALQTYADFYENLVGNTTYALSLYNDILRTSLPADNPIKIAAQKEISRLNSLKSQFKKEDALLKKIAANESISQAINSEQAKQLLSIINQKPNYYRLSEVYYRLGRSFLATENYHEAYLSLTKSLQMKPAINFYLPVSVYKDLAYSKWVRLTINSVSLIIIGGFLLAAIIAFYLSCPWRWFKLKHLYIFLITALVWLIVFAVSYKLLVSGKKLSDKMIGDISATEPYFISSLPGSPNRQVLLNLYIYSLVGLSIIFVFSIGTSRLKGRWTAISINTLFSITLFVTLTTIFYMQNCDQKSVFNSSGQNGILRYFEGDNYFVTFAIEPYVLTNPRAYPNLTLINVADVHLKEWIEKYNASASDANKPAQERK